MFETITQVLVIPTLCPISLPLTTSRRMGIGVQVTLRAVELNDLAETCCGAARGISSAL